MKTRAAVLRKGGEPWELTELDLDEPKAGEVLIRYEAAGLCHSDEHIRATGTTRLQPAGGFTKQDVQAWLMEHCGRTGADLRRAGKNGLRGIARFADPDTSADEEFSRILPSPRHVRIVVAGARNAAISMVVRIFGEWSGTATPVGPLTAALEHPTTSLGVSS